MKFKILFTILISVIVLTSFTFPENLEKKIDKEVVDVFGINSFQFIPIEVSENLNLKLPAKITGQNLFKLIDGDTFFGYVFIDKANSKTAYFDYLVIFDNDLTIRRSKVLIYREEYGGEIGSKRWLKQFEGKSSTDSLENIMAISGATISVNSMTNAINDLLKTINILYQNKVI